MENNNNSIIHDSFMLLMTPDNVLKKEYFCNDDCYYKCLNVIDKIKKGSIDMSKINWNTNKSNIISQIVTYYYNLGLSQNNNKEYSI